MSQSLVPSIKMSRGNNRKTKFNISANAHTTAEVGYLQPIYSKILLPKSDLKLKVNDFVRMSSLIVPTFGKLDLRHWFNCTPLSSLWSCYGSFMSQSQYNDLDSESGASIRTNMPKVSLNEIFGWMFASYAHNVQAQSTSCVPFNGNITYLRELNNGKRGGILSFDDTLIQDNILANSAELRLPSTHIKLLCLCTGYSGIYGIPGLIIDEPRPQTEVINEYAYRTRVPVPFLYNGFVVKNTNNFMRHVKNASGKTTFPTPEECPYIVIRCRKASDDDLDFKSNMLGTSSTSLTAPSYDGCLEFFPLTMKMFQGDTSLKLYMNGWASKIKQHTDTAFYHPTGNAEDWTLDPDDAYFTGDLDGSKFDVSGNLYESNPLDPSQTPVLKCGYSINWSRRFQRLRKLFVGLGYQFNPFDTQPQTMWKIMHYYKAWFDMFYPKRDTQYYQTPLSRFVNLISYHGSVCCDYALDAMSNDNIRGIDDFIDMLMACADAKYLMPIDYYSLADPNPTEVEGTKNEQISDNVYVAPNGYHNPYELGDGVQSYNSTVRDGVEINLDPNNKAVINGNTITIAEKFTQFLVKKRIVGKSISDRMRAIYGAVDPHDKSHESTWCFGTSSSDINISAVMSQSETEDMHLGDYAGTGIGGGTSRTFSVDGNDADMYIVTIMSAIVPKLSYYQGHSRENMVGSSPLDFVTPLWDGVGYEDVSASEYIADICDTPVYQVQGTSNIHRSMAEINGKTIGLVPRGTWYKVNPHDVLNGDMSRPSVMDSLNPYVLTRDVDPDFGITPIDMRTVNPDGFNKIFNESSSLDDHFIIQAQVEAEMYAPLKSISTSYDTFDNDEDGTIEVSHS